MADPVRPCQVKLNNTCLLCICHKQLLRAKSFENRLSLPAQWRGVRDAELEAVSGIKGATFVHAGPSTTDKKYKVLTSCVPGGFIGGASTREGVMQMVEESLKQTSSE